VGEYSLSTACREKKKKEKKDDLPVLLRKEKKETGHGKRGEKKKGV